MEDVLVRNARDGDQGAFSKLVEEYYRSIYGLAFSVVGDWQAAEDIAQDVFLAAWVNLGKLRTLNAFGAWLRQIARNLARNWIRSDTYRRSLVERREALAAESDTIQCSAVEELTRADARAEVWGALQTLSPRLREVVVLFYLEENSIAQTATVLGVTENSVKKRLQHARPKLRGYFEKQWKAEMERERRRINSREAGERFMAGAALGPVSSLSGRLGMGAGSWLHGDGMGQAVLALRFSSASVKLAAVALAIVAVSGVWMVWNADRASPASDATQPVSKVSPPALHTVSAGEIDAVPAQPIAARNVKEGTLVEKPGDTASDSTAVDATGETVTIAGHVLDEQGRPIQGATVTVVATGLDASLMVTGGGGFGGVGVVGAVEGALSGGGFGGGGFGGGGGGAAGGGYGGGGEVFRGGAVPTPAFQDRNENALVDALLDEARRHVALSDADGSFSIANVPGEGLVIVSAGAPGYSLQGTAISPTSGVAVTDLMLTLSPGISVDGRVLSARGQPMADALLQVTALAWSHDGAAGGWGRSPQDWGWVRTDARGAFRLTVEDAGYATILVRSKAHGKATFQGIRVEPDAFVDLRFPERLVVRGKITQHDGAPAAGHTVQLVGHAGVIVEDEEHRIQAGGETARPAYEATTDAAGTYRIADVDPRMRYTVCIFDGNRTPLATGVELGAPAAGQTLFWNYTISRPITVRGGVISEATKEPAVGAVILCKAASEASAEDIPIAMPAAQAVTGPDGSFEMRITTGAGTYVFGIQTVTGFRSLSQTDVREGESTVVNLALPGSWSRRFLVVDESGNPLAGVSVVIATEGSDMGYGYPQETGEDGRIHITDLVAGEAVVCRFQYAGLEAESDRVVGHAGMELAEETIVIDMSR